MAEHNNGMKASNLYIAQVKGKYGIIEHENYNKPKSDGARQPKYHKEKGRSYSRSVEVFSDDIKFRINTSLIVR